MGSSTASVQPSPSQNAFALLTCVPPSVFCIYLGRPAHFIYKKREGERYGKEHAAPAGRCRAHPEPNGAGHCAAAAQRDGPQRQLYGQAAGRNGKARAGRRRFVAQAENRGRCNAHRPWFVWYSAKRKLHLFQFVLIDFWRF